MRPFSVVKLGHFAVPSSDLLDAVITRQSRQLSILNEIDPFYRYEVEVRSGDIEAAPITAPTVSNGASVVAFRRIAPTGTQSSGVSRSRPNQTGCDRFTSASSCKLSGRLRSGRRYNAFGSTVRRLSSCRVSSLSRLDPRAWSWRRVQDCSSSRPCEETARAGPIWSCGCLISPDFAVCVGGPPW